MSGGSELELIMFQMDANIRRLEKKMDQANGKVDKATRAMQKRLDQAAKDLDRSFGSAFGTMEAKAGLAFGAITGYALKVASDANELESAFQVAFGTASKGAEDFSVKLADRVGRAAIDVKSQMTDLQLVLSGMGLEAEQSLEIVKRLTQRSIDIGSLFNVSDADAMRAVISGITGETEPLKRFGAVINDTAVKAELMRLGFKGNAEDASDAAKAIARTNLIMQKTAVAAGDAERTMDSLANRTKTAQAEFKTAAIALGNQLYPAAIKATQGATGLIKEFTALPSGVQLASLALLGLVAASGPIAQTIKGLQALITLTAQARIALGGLALTGLTGAGTLLAENWLSQASTKARYDVRDRVVANPGRASNEDLAKAIAVAKDDREMAMRVNGDVKGTPIDRLYNNLVAEQNRRQAEAAQAAAVAAFKAQKQVKSDLDAGAKQALGALGLTGAQKEPASGGNGKAASAAQRKAEAEAKRAAAENLKNTRRVEDWNLRAEMDLLQVKQSYTQTAADRRDLALQLLEIDQQGYKRDLERAVADKDMTQAEADKLLSARKAVDDEQRRGLVRQSELDIAEERLRSEQAVADLTASYLSIASSLAKTQKEREAIARQMLAAEQAAQRKQLEARIASGEISAADAPRARSELNRLQGIQNKALEKDFEGPLKRYLETIIDLNDVAQNAAVDGLQDLSRGLVDAALNAGDLGDVVRNTFRKMVADVLTAQTEALIKKGTSGVLSFLGGLFGGKRAGGGAVQAGKVYQVNDGGGQKEFFASSLDGRVMTAAQMNAATSKPMSRPVAAVQQTLLFDLRGALTTEDVLQQMNTLAEQAAVAGAQGGAQLARTQAMKRQGRIWR